MRYHGISRSHDSLTPSMASLRFTRTPTLRNCHYSLYPHTLPPPVQLRRVGGRALPRHEPGAAGEQRDQQADRPPGVGRGRRGAQRGSGGAEAWVRGSEERWVQVRSWRGEWRGVRGA